MSYIIEFIFGGGIIVGMTCLCKILDPKYAAILYALPIQFTIALISIYAHSNKEVAKNLCLSSSYSLLMTVGFVGLCYFLLKNFNLWVSLTISYLVFISFIIIFLRYCKI